MGILNPIKKFAKNVFDIGKKNAGEYMGKAEDAVVSVSALRPEQLEQIEKERQKYLEGSEEKDQDGRETVRRCIQAINVEITQTYLELLSTGYCPVVWENGDFIPENRIYYFDITKWVVDTSEKSMDKLISLYQVLSQERCTIALIYNRKAEGCTVTMAVENCQESDQPTIANGFCDRLVQAFRGNFPGAELSESQIGIPQPLQTLSEADTVAAVSNLVSERSEDFVSQSIEKLLDGIVPQTEDEEYTILLLAEPADDLEERHSRLYELYSSLSPYATWQKMRGSNESLTKSASAHAGLSGKIMFFSGEFAYGVADMGAVGKQEGQTDSYTNYGVKHMLELLEKQVKRLDESAAMGMWEVATYVLSSDYETAVNVAHMYLSLTQGDESYLGQSAINVWSGRDAQKHSVADIIPWLQALQHPQFGLSKERIAEDKNFQVFPVLTTAATSLSGNELAYALNFPRKSVRGLPVYECVPFGREVVQYNCDLNRSLVPLGHIYHMRREEKSLVALDRENLTSHVFVTGSTGAGKSNAIYTLIKHLCLDHENTSFLVIEPAKGEYKDALGGYDVQVFGTNPYKTPLLRLNPFSFPEDTHILEHIDRLVEIFNACWPMYAAMPAVLKAAMEQAYLGCGWSLSTSTCPGKRIFPTFRDVMNNLSSVIDSKGFSNDTQGDYKGALMTRLESLTNGSNGQVLCEYEEIDNKTLFDQNVIVDLSRVGSTETKSLLMGVLILKLQEYRMAQRTAGQNLPDSGLRHITVLEEAHNLLRRMSTEQSQESSNLQGKSVEMLTNAIAEMRTYGEGFVIADQSPGLLDMAAIRNTNTKIILRLPDEGDRLLVGKAAGLNDDQIVELSRLDTGVAAVYQNHWLEPVLCKIFYFDKPKGFSYTPPACIPNPLTEEICKTLLQDVPDGALLEREGVDRIKTWIDRREIGQEVKRQLYQVLIEKKPLDEPHRVRALYCLVHGRNIVQKARFSTMTVAAARAMVDRQIKESLEISESMARKIRKVVLYYAAENLRDDVPQYAELLRIGGIW